MAGVRKTRPRTRLGTGTATDTSAPTLRSPSRRRGAPASPSLPRPSGAAQRRRRSGPDHHSAQGPSGDSSSRRSGRSPRDAPERLAANATTGGDRREYRGNTKAGLLSWRATDLHVAKRRGVGVGCRTPALDETRARSTGRNRRPQSRAEASVARVLLRRAKQQRASSRQPGVQVAVCRRSTRLLVLLRDRRKIGSCPRHCHSTDVPHRFVDESPELQAGLSAAA
jgi:hypothetical protein